MDQGKNKMAELETDGVVIDDKGKSQSSSVPGSSTKKPDLVGLAKMLARKRAKNDLTDDSPIQPPSKRVSGRPLFPEKIKGDNQPE